MQIQQKSRLVRAALIGAGNRGREIYGAWARGHPERLKIAAVADPDPARRALAASEHGIPPELAFFDWRDLVASARVDVEACLVCTQDAMHAEPALAALSRGWHVLLEKPMATTREDCLRLVAASEAAGRQLRVCHVVRYTDFFQALKRCLDSGIIGTPIHIAHTENVSFWHFGHSYVRGNWGRSADSSPLILAKTCHDLDILYWLVGRPALRLSSFGSLSWYRPENAPADAPARCLDGCPHAKECLWEADSLYGSGSRVLGVGHRAENPLVRAASSMAISGTRVLRGIGRAIPGLSSLGEWKSWPASAMTSDFSPEAKERALREGPYGRCIYRCGNDQPDHEAVSIEFDGGLTATMTVQGLSNLDGRTIRVDGSEGTIEGRFTYAGERLEYWDHRRMRRHLLYRKGLTGDAHGGGDAGLISSFVDSLVEGGGEALTSARASLESHLMGFAAEKARLDGRVVSLDEFRPHLEKTTPGASL
jgi:predicted dehydrogenase